jgi:hypothetical protein
MNNNTQPAKTNALWNFTFVASIFALGLTILYFTPFGHLILADLGIVDAR